MDVYFLFQKRIDKVTRQRLAEHRFDGLKKNCKESQEFDIKILFEI